MNLVIKADLLLKQAQVTWYVSKRIEWFLKSNGKSPSLTKVLAF